MVTTIGFLTIGQSPREDAVPEIVRLLERKVRVVERGALDGLSRCEILELRPGKRDHHLITRLRDGSPVVVGKNKILPLLRKQIGWLMEQQARMIALLCTDEFPAFGRPVILLQPSRLLFRATVTLLKSGTLGIFVPLESQKKAAKRRWQKTGLELVIEALNPYQEPSRLGEAAERMRAKKVDLVVFDCLGYPSETAAKIEAGLNKPSLGPRAALAGEINRRLSGTIGENKEYDDGS
jgi:protein AroM